MLLIAGTKVEENSVGSGTFNCPAEGSKQPYHHVRLEKKATAFFVPVATMSELGEYVECQSCGATYEPAVLEYQTQEDLDTALAVAVLRLALEVVLADGRVTDDERQAVIDTANLYLDPPGLTLSDLSEMLATLQVQSAKTRSKSTASALAELGSALNMEGRRIFVRTAYCLAAADGEVADSEREVIVKTARRLGFSKNEAGGLVAALEVEAAGEVVWQITHKSLADLEDSLAWADWAIKFSDSLKFTPEEIYGPGGKIGYWGLTWPTAEAMTSTLYNNMGGGVPAAVIDELVRLSAPK